MTEHYSFFDSQLVDGVLDRVYNAEQFTRFFKALITTGLMRNDGSELKVSVNGSNMISTIATGTAFIVGKQYVNDEPLAHIHDTESIGKSRIDRIVIRMDGGTESRHVKSYIKKGIASNTPVAPTLDQTPNLYEISLCQVKVVGGQTYISSNDIIDERGTAVICPWAGSNVLPSYDDNLLAQHISNEDIHFKPGEKTQLFQSVSSGKLLVANAITGKGIPTIGNAEFATMAANIGKIQTGLKSAKGYMNRDSEYVLSVTSLDFTPRVIIVKHTHYNGDHAIYVNRNSFGPVSASDVNFGTFFNPNPGIIKAVYSIFTITPNGFIVRPTNNELVISFTYSFIAIE